MKLWLITHFTVQQQNTPGAKVCTPNSSFFFLSNAIPSASFYANVNDVRLFQTFNMSQSAATTAWHCYPRPILSSHNQLTRLNTVSTMSRLETSPTSTRPASTANFILIPLIGTPGLSAMAPDLPSFPSPDCAAPGGSSLAIAKEERTGQVAFTGKAPVHLPVVTVQPVSEEERGIYLLFSWVVDSLQAHKHNVSLPIQKCLTNEARKWAQNPKLN